MSTTAIDLSFRSIRETYEAKDPVGETVALVSSVLMIATMVSTIAVTPISFIEALFASNLFISSAVFLTGFLGITTVVLAIIYLPRFLLDSAGSLFPRTPPEMSLLAWGEITILSKDRLSEIFQVRRLLPREARERFETAYQTLNTQLDEALIPPYAHRYSAQAVAQKIALLVSNFFQADLDYETCDDFIRRGEQLDTLFNSTYFFEAADAHALYTCTDDEAAWKIEQVKNRVYSALEKHFHMNTALLQSVGIIN